MGFGKRTQMKFALLSILPFLVSVPVRSVAESAEGSIRGSVVVQGSMQPLASAILTLNKSRWVTMSDEEGKFEFTDVPSGSYTISARMVGYEEKHLIDIRVEQGKITPVTVELAESAIELEGIEVSGEFTNRQSDVRSSVLDVAPRRAKTLAGVGEDVLRTLQALPGVLSPNDFSSQLVVRGSGPDQNLIIMDDIEIFNPYRLYGLISMFNPETVTDINLISGGFPARYGDRLSAVLDVTNKEGDKSTPLGGSLNASITNANLVLNGRSPFGFDGSYVISARRTYYDLILGPIAKNTGLVSGDVAFPNFSDLQAKLVIQPHNHHRFIFNSVFSNDAVEIVSGPDRPVQDSVSISDETKNDVLGVSWHYLPSNDFLQRVGFSWYRNSGDTEFGGEFIDPALNREQFEGDTTGIRLFNLEVNSHYLFRKYALKYDLTRVTGAHTIEAGSGIDFLETSLIWSFRPDETLRALLAAAFLDDFVQTKRYSRFNLFVQDKVKVSDRFTVQAGLRFDYYQIIGRSYLEPRINLLYALDPITTIRGAIGLYRQSPGYEKLLDQNAFFDLTSSATGSLSAEKASHYVLGIERWLDYPWLARIETYYKRFDDVIIQDVLPGTVYEATAIPGADIRLRSGWTDPVPVPADSLTTNPVNGAHGSSYGVEILLEKKNTHAGDRLSGWLNYALARSTRVLGGILTPFRFDQRHTVNVVVDYTFNSWLTAGMRWKYGSNFPYTPPVGIKPRIVSVTRNGQEEKVIQVDRDGDVIFDIDRGGEANKNSARLPAYHRLDIRMTAKADYWGLEWNFYVDVINVYNRKNILAYAFYINDDLTIGKNATSMLPLLPTIGFSVRF